ncbi:SDR family oxidoreductase [Fulvivirgaceae bacterium BMA12]|uniref:SDR family oxidoreductase n=1 Tax=Agaribacillus aureus TaxID=3051825 RepID=A0ABT8LCG7_9BACT|nr:SDR family oxidoreductase [Fulvivirgaceae bacterium BMA12]
MKNIIVTGASRGVGFNITETLVKEYYHVIAINRNVSDALKDLQIKFPDSLTIIPYDLADTENIHSKIFKEEITYDKSIHGLINNAAMAYDDIITNINFKRLEGMYKVNVFSPMILTKYAIRHMLLHKVAGSIIHISSISAHTGYKGLSMYASTKGALESFSKNTAREWGEVGIRSNCIVPGFMETEMSSGLNSQQKDRIYKRTSLKKPTFIESVSKTVSFLLSDDAFSITGQNIHVDSGTI